MIAVRKTDQTLARPENVTGRAMRRRPNHPPALGGTPQIADTGHEVERRTADRRAFGEETTPGYPGPTMVGIVGGVWKQCLR